MEKHCSTGLDKKDLGGKKETNDSLTAILFNSIPKSVAVKDTEYMVLSMRKAVSLFQNRLQLRTQNIWCCQ